MRYRKTRRETLRVARNWTLILLLSAAPALAGSGAGTGDKGADMALDALVLRPLGLLATGIGAVVFVVSLPFTLPSGDVGEAACELVQEPFAYTFSRPLGDMERVDSHCQDGAKR